MDTFKQYLTRTGMEHKDYQYEGVKWCLANEQSEFPLYGVRGGFIMDEMGLGKTIMAIGLMLSNFMKKTLIVLPPILINQWTLQIYKTTGHKALVYHGASKRKIDLAALNQSTIVITSYGDVAYTKAPATTNLLHDVEWSRIIYDEAHHLRNSKTVLYTRVKMLKSSIQWFVTGTPIQNRIKDFYNLCRLLGLPSCFYMNRVSKDALHSSFILKRTKQQVGILLPSISADKKLVCWKNRNELKISKQIHRCVENADKHEKLMYMSFAKQSCVMGSLLSKHSSLLKENNVSVSKIPSTNDSCKIDEVIEDVVSRKDNGCGKIIFCYFHKEIDELAKRLGGLGMSVSIFDGRVTSHKKKQEIFNKGSEVLILQIQTGCEGLNLQERYSEIYFVSPHWNPAIEEQAIARCHRIGQNKTVYVKRYIMNNFNELDITMDDYVSAVQDKKREIIVAFG